jgi:hypothetical protein
VSVLPSYVNENVILVSLVRTELCFVVLDDIKDIEL